MKLARFWEKFTRYYWSEWTLLNKALSITSKRASKNLKFEDAPMWVRIRLKFFKYGMLIYWTKGLPLKYKQWKLYKKTGIKL